VTLVHVEDGRSLQDVVRWTRIFGKQLISDMDTIGLVLESALGLVEDASQLAVGDHRKTCSKSGRAFSIDKPYMSQIL
jgi:hypothetical protein